MNTTATETTTETHDALDLVLLASAFRAAYAVIDGLYRHPLVDAIYYRTNAPAGGMRFYGLSEAEAEACYSDAAVRAMAADLAAHIQRAKATVDAARPYTNTSAWLFIALDLMAA